MNCWQLISKQVVSIVVLDVMRTYIVGNQLHPLLISSQHRRSAFHGRDGGSGNDKLGTIHLVSGGRRRAIVLIRAQQGPSCF